MKLKHLLFITVTSLATTFTYAQTSPSKASVSPTSQSVSGKQGTTRVSYYGPGFHGRKTASGDRFNMYGLTVAHKTLPFGTKVQFTCSQTGRTVVAKVTDRGPYVHGRSFDLSLGTAKALGIIERGVANVQYKILK